MMLEFYRDDPKNDDWKLLNKSGEPIAKGTQRQMFAFVKNHVPDGRFRLVGPTMKVHVIRENGIVGPDPDGVCLDRAGWSGLTN